MNSRYVYLVCISAQVLVGMLGVSLVLAGVTNYGLISIGLAFAVSLLTAHIRMRRVLAAFKRSLEAGKDELNRGILRSVTQLEERFNREVSLIENSARAQNARLETFGQNLSQVTTGSYTSRFDPQAIAATEVKSKPTAQSAGRLAADQVMSGDPTEKLRAVMASGRDRHLRKIAMVGDGSTHEALSIVGEVTIISPGQLQSSLEAETSYLVIDEAAFGSGAWADADDAQQSGVMLRLLELIRDAREKGIVILLVSRCRAAHYSATLQELSDVVVEDGQSDLKWNDDVYLPVLSQLLNLTNQRNNDEFSNNLR